MGMAHAISQEAVIPSSFRPRFRQFTNQPRLARLDGSRDWRGLLILISVLDWERRLRKIEKIPEGHGEGH